MTPAGLQLQSSNLQQHICQVRTSSNTYAKPAFVMLQVRFLATTDGSATSWKDLYNCHSDAAAADTNTKSLIFALEHHCMQVEQAFFHHAPQPLYFIASERTASGLTGILTGATKFCLFKGNRQPLREVVEV